MNNEFKYCIGVMSGTSLDGLDLVYVKFNNSNYRDFKILASSTVSYSKEWKYSLQNAISFSKTKIHQLDIDYGKFLGNQINTFIAENSINKIDFIASHGHTVFHQPENGITLQIGSGQEIANLTKQQVICDFRTQDVALGGQGAPLVPIGDELLFSNYSYCMNLGGFANVSFKKYDKRLAFDICPVNIVMNIYAEKLGLAFDDGGKIASSGTLNQELLARLNSLDFYVKEYPKSLGLEWVTKNILPILNDFSIKEQDILHTFVEHVAKQVTDVLEKNSSVFITGGGAYNSYLLERFQSYKKMNYIVPSNEIVEYKEALIFAFLGLLRSKNEVNCLESVTGAKKDHSSGRIFNPSNS